MVSTSVEGEGLEQGEAGRTIGQLLQLSWGRYWVSEPEQGSGRWQMADFLVHLPLKHLNSAHSEPSTSSAPADLLLPPHPHYRRWSHWPPSYSTRNPRIVLNSFLSQGPFDPRQFSSHSLRGQQSSTRVLTMILSLLQSSNGLPLFVSQSQTRAWRTAAVPPTKGTSEVGAVQAQVLKTLRGCTNQQELKIRGARRSL